MKIKTLEKRERLIIFGVIFILLLIGFIFAQTQDQQSQSQQNQRIQGVESGERFPDTSSGGIIQGASYISFRPQYYQPYLNSRFDSGVYRDSLFPRLDPNQCGAGQDFVIQISPLGCTPAVVRSDLLEEQNVPVFCQLNAMKVNPLVDVEAIDYITFNDRTNNPLIAGVGFHPARSAIKNNREILIGSPVLNNIGYTVIVLKQVSREKDMPESVDGLIEATIRYNLDNIFGTGNREFYLTEMSDQEWQENYKKYGFWKGKGYIRVENIDDENQEAEINIYSDKDHKTASFVLQTGKSRESVIPGYYCRAYMDVQFKEIDAYDTSVVINVDEDYFQLRKGQRFLDNKCTIKEIEKSGLYEKVEISCARNKDIILEFSPKIDISINGNEREVSVGDILYSAKNNDEKNVYVGYLGVSDGIPFIITVNSPKNPADFKESALYSRIPTIVNTLSFKSGNLIVDNLFLNGYKSIGIGVEGTSFVATGDHISGIVPAEGYGEERNFYLKDKYTEDLIKNLDIKFISFSGPADKSYQSIDNSDDGDKFEKLFNDALLTYREIVENFPNEKPIDVQKLEEQIENSNQKVYFETYAEQALWKAQIFAGYSGKYQTQLDLLNKYIEKYPTSPNTEEINRLKERILLSNGGKTSDIISINDENKIITLEDINVPDFNNYGVKIILENAGEGFNGEYDLIKGETLYLSNNDFIVFNEITKNTARFDVSIKRSLQQQTTNVGTTLSLKERESKNLEGVDKNYRITVSKINYKSSAKVVLTPRMKNVETKANFSFKIGIEKRAIQLTPEKIQNKIKYLDEQIAKWQRLSDNLGKTVKGLKAACLATGATLTVKNFFGNIGGKSFARAKVMKSPNGWNDKCSNAIATGYFDKEKTQTAGNYKSMDECFIKNADQINKEVNQWYESINQQNNEIKTLEKDFSKTSFLGEKVIDDQKFMNVYISNIQTDLKAISLQDCQMDNKDLNYNEAVNRINFDNWNNNHFSKEDARDLQLYSKILKSSSDENIRNQARRQLCDQLGIIYKRTEEATRVASITEKLRDKGFGDLVVDNYGNKDSIGGIYRGNELKGNQLPEFDGKEQDKTYPVQTITYNNQEYLLVLNQAKDSYTINKIFKIDNSGVISILTDQNIISEINGRFTSFKKYDKTKYENKYLKPELRYYETEPYKGLPGVVPFDCNNGWYAATKQTLPIFGNIQAFDQSGRVTSFYVCNVGENQREEFDQNLGDDICELVNLGTGQPYDVFPGLTESESREIIQQSVKYVQQASQKYESVRGKTNARVAIGTCSDIIVGRPQVNVPQIQCTDVMSPTECKLLFNVCDPVICPSSRCDLGGNYRVNDVVQSGIIGSIALCLPNYRQGIVVPVCLTGIQAGVDGLNSIFKASRDCLQEQLETGRTVGICDEIQSIYMCELLWKEAGSISRIAIPKLVEFITGQNIHGGGEYLSVQDSWNNVEKSVSYMRDYYGANAYKAFKARTTDDAGSLVCKAFVSARYPTNKDFFDALIEPDSPEQYHAWFTEIPFSTVTVPATSQYKVFYHIYAGKDIGAYYSVYMKSPQGISGFYENPTIQVATGYIARGSFASETRDFTAPSGYKELCISVNGQEECGFQKVTTSFALDYLRNKYLEEQASQTGITKESQCVSGTTSLYSLVNPNLQAGVEEAINPRLYDHGIIRICATDNPGSGTDPDVLDPKKSRWVDVGYCDNQRLRCWLDTQTVASQININYIENRTLEKVSDEYINRIIEEQRRTGGYKDEATINSEINKINIGNVTDENVDEKIREVDNIMQNIIHNYQKAHVLLLKGEIYEKAAKIVLQRIIIRSEGLIIENYVRNPAIIEEKSVEEKFTYDSAIEGARKRTGKYSDNKGFIDQLYNQELLTDEQYDDIKGIDWIDNDPAEENMDQVRRYLEENKIGEVKIIEEIPTETTAVSNTYKERYNEFKEFFVRHTDYATNSPPFDLTECEFKTLLVAIAQKESSLGYPNGQEKDDNLLLGYDDPAGGGQGRYPGVDNQIRGASDTLRRALNKESSTYSECNDKTGNDQILCILSVYNQGTFNSQGVEYAQEVIQYWDNWKNELCKSEEKGVEEQEETISSDFYIKVDKGEIATNSNIFVNSDIIIEWKRDCVETRAILKRTRNNFFDKKISGRISNSGKSVTIPLTQFSVEAGNGYYIEAECIPEKGQAPIKIDSREFVINPL